MQANVKAFWMLIGISVVAIGLAFVVRTYTLSVTPVVTPESVPMGTIPADVQPSPTTTQALTQTNCEASGGHWNSCGSLCRGEPAGTVCAQVCIPQCECAPAATECPAGFACSDVLTDAKGVQTGICRAPTDATL